MWHETLETTMLPPGAYAITPDEALRLIAQGPCRCTDPTEPPSCDSCYARDVRRWNHERQTEERNMIGVKKCQACHASLRKGAVERLDRVLCLLCGMNEYFDRYRDHGVISKWMLNEALLRAAGRDRGEKIDRGDLVARLELDYAAMREHVALFQADVWSYGPLRDRVKPLVAPALLGASLEISDGTRLALRLTVEKDRAILLVRSDRADKTHVEVSLPLVAGEPAELRNLYATRAWVVDALSEIRSTVLIDGVAWAALPVDMQEVGS